MNKLRFIFSEEGYLNHILLFSLLSVFFIGVQGANKIVYFFQATLILSFIKFEINKKKLFVSILTIIFLLIFTKNFNSIKIALIFSLIIFSFNFEDIKIKKIHNLNFLFFSVVVILIALLMKPNTSNYVEKFELNYPDKLDSVFILLKKDLEKKKIKGKFYILPEEKLFKKDKKIFFHLKNQNLQIPIKNYFERKNDYIFVINVSDSVTLRHEILTQNIYKIFTAKESKSKKMSHFKYENTSEYLEGMDILDKEYFKKNPSILMYVKNPVLLNRNIKTNDPILCRLHKSILQKEKIIQNLCRSDVKTNVRFRINSIDSNYTALVLMLISLLFVLQLKDRKIQLFAFIFLWFLISYFTKSRTTLIFGACYFVYYYLYFFTGPKIILGSYILSHFFVIFLGYLALNAVVDPNNIWHPEAEGKSLLPVTNDPYDHFLTRYFQFFDSSSYIRFTRNFQSYLVIINDFYNILFPDNVQTISDFEYITKRDAIHNFDVDQYHPHNFFLYSIKEFGLIVTLVYHYNLFSIIMKNTNFRISVFPLLFSSIFLGAHLILIIHIACLFSFKRQNNILLFFDKYIKKINGN